MNIWFIHSLMLAATQERPDSATRARIIAAAGKRFSAFGYRRTGMAEIARQAGVAAGTVYRYFASKEDVFREVVRDLHESWLARTREVLSAPGTALERLARLGEASVEFNHDNTLMSSIFRRDAEIVFAPLIEELHEQLLRQNVAMLADVVRDGIREGSIRAVDPERAAFFLFMAGDVLSNHQTYYPYSEVLGLFGDIVFHGLVPR